METEITVGEKPCSRYTGGAVAPRLMKWLAFIVSLITLSLAHPAMVCWQERYRCRHTYIDGKRLKFDGYAAQLMGKYICWILLTIVTLFVYSFWLSVKLKKWVTKHTHFADEAEDDESGKKPGTETMTGEELAAYEAKVAERRKTAHTLGTISLILTFIAAPIGPIFNIVGIVLGAVYKEKMGIRLSTVSLSIMAVAITALVVAAIVRAEITVIIISLSAVALVAIAACITVFIISRKWKSYKAPAKN